jgi:hypothetical protein
LSADDKSGIPGATNDQFRLYPNPSSDLLFVEPGNIPYGKVRIEIHSIDGVPLKIIQLPYSGSPLVLQVDDLKQGTYVIRMISYGSVRTGRVVVMDP